MMDKPKKKRLPHKGGGCWCPDCKVNRNYNQCWDEREKLLEVCKDTLDHLKQGMVCKQNIIKLEQAIAKLEGKGWISLRRLKIQINLT